MVMAVYDPHFEPEKRGLERISFDPRLNYISKTTGRGEVYFFLYDDKSVSETLKILGSFARRSDKGKRSCTTEDKLDFSWHDCAVLSERLRKRGDEQKKEEECRRKEQESEAKFRKVRRGREIIISRL